MTLRRARRKGCYVYFEDDADRYRVFWIAWERKYSMPEMFVYRPGWAQGYWEDSLLAPSIIALEPLITDRDRAHFLTRSIQEAQHGP